MYIPSSPSMHNVQYSCYNFHLYALPLLSFTLRMFHYRYVMSCASKSIDMLLSMDESFLLPVLLVEPAFVL